MRHGPEVSFPQGVIGYALLEDPRVLDRHLQPSKPQDFRKFPDYEIMSELAPHPGPGVETKTVAVHAHSSLGPVIRKGLGNQGQPDRIPGLG